MTSSLRLHQHTEPPYRKYHNKFFKCGFSPRDLVMIFSSKDGTSPYHCVLLWWPANLCLLLPSFYVSLLFCLYFYLYVSIQTLQARRIDRISQLLSIVEQPFDVPNPTSRTRPCSTSGKQLTGRLEVLLSGRTCAQHS